MEQNVLSVEYFPVFCELPMTALRQNWLRPAILTTVISNEMKMKIPYTHKTAVILEMKCALYFPMFRYIASHSP